MHRRGTRFPGRSQQSDSPLRPGIRRLNVCEAEWSRHSGLYFQASLITIPRAMGERCVRYGVSCPDKNANPANSHARRVNPVNELGAGVEQNLLKLDGRLVVVTGAAGGGIGTSVTRRLAEVGATGDVAIE